MMVGLHGVTTSSGKLAKWLTKQGRKPMLVAADVYRPAAMDQLETLGKQLEIPTLVCRGKGRAGHCAKAQSHAAEQGATSLFTMCGKTSNRRSSGRGTGSAEKQNQPSGDPFGVGCGNRPRGINVASHFDEALSINGSILTKLDGDARGGAALSMKSVTQNRLNLPGPGKNSRTSSPFTPSAWRPAFWEWATSSVWSKKRQKTSMSTKPRSLRRRCGKGYSP